MLPIISGTLKAMNFKFGRNILRLNPSKRPLKMLQTRGYWHSQGLSKIIRAVIYRAHHAVIFAIAELSCYSWLEKAKFVGEISVQRNWCFFKISVNTEVQFHNFSHVSSRLGWTIKKTITTYNSIFFTWGVLHDCLRSPLIHVVGPFALSISHFARSLRMRI